MFLFNSLGKMLSKNSSSSDLGILPSGQLYWLRPNSRKSPRECLFKDSQAAIRRAGAEFQYQLVISRVYEEGEEELEEGNLDEEEFVFLIDQQLHFFHTEYEGSPSFWWSNLEDENQYFEFVAEVGTDPDDLEAFQLTMLQCMYERKYRKPHTDARDEDLKEFIYDPEASVTADLSPSPQETSAPSTPVRQISQTKVPTQVSTPEGNSIALVKGDLYLFSISHNTFLLEASEAFVNLIEVNQYEYWLSIQSDGRPYISQPVGSDMNPVFSNEHHSFIWCFTDNNGSVYSWSLKFIDTHEEQTFIESFSRCMYETLNRQSFSRVKSDDQKYITEAYQEDTEMVDAFSESEQESDRSEDDGDDDDEEEEESAVKFVPSNKSAESNSQLAVGCKHDRSFVVRGNKIGVFKHTGDDQLEFSTTINNVSTPNGKMFAPSKVMLHEEDSSMVLLNPKDSHSLYKMDLEYGKVVEEWPVHEYIECSNFMPDTKFAQLTPHKTLVGMSHNAVYRVDPRLPHYKIVDTQLKQYVTKNDFSCAATTENGQIAVASNKGDIRLFNKLGINAKTALPPLGDPILGIDVTASGRFIVATCKTYLLLIDTMIKSAATPTTGFDKSFQKNEKPAPKRLQLKPEHVAYMNEPVAFTPAKFNTSEAEDERTIVTSTGPYVITWNFRRVKQGRLDDYQIKRYTDTVVADNFKFGEDRNIVVALPQDVTMVKKKTLKSPVRALQTPTRKLQSRSGIVNSPY
ncbi:Vid27 family protein [Basidiobolus meristosporus CBS 931.73]|uniref:Vid27 family protein n=1 Tax=Basidiobolus meristosporus CBS 931.73 TaxID=1314790 RepID=A0A1Y1Z794_9FUNG|nr:Vid27 family protein [Basidiobolus meristosporus CBS 931.73]|eukprot:ORY06086.1 Vid27 family protein [Basidiobolus meristosporus CBS 931.73]